MPFQFRNNECIPTTYAYLNAFVQIPCLYLEINAKREYMCGGRGWLCYVIAMLYVGNVNVQVHVVHMISSPQKRNKPEYTTGRLRTVSIESARGVGVDTNRWKRDSISISRTYIWLTVRCLGDGAKSSEIHLLSFVK